MLLFLPHLGRPQSHQCAHREDILFSLLHSPHQQNFSTTPSFPSDLSWPQRKLTCTPALLSKILNREHCLFKPAEAGPDATLKRDPLPRGPRQTVVLVWHRSETQVSSALSLRPKVSQGPSLPSPCSFWLTFSGSPFPLSFSFSPTHPGNNVFFPFIET